jgi:hypothetical protein
MSKIAHLSIEKGAHESLPLKKEAHESLPLDSRHVVDD